MKFRDLDLILTHQEKYLTEQELYNFQKIMKLYLGTIDILKMQLKSFMNLLKIALMPYLTQDLQLKKAQETLSQKL